MVESASFSHILQVGVNHLRYGGLMMKKSSKWFNYMISVTYLVPILFVLSMEFYQLLRHKGDVNDFAKDLEAIASTLLVSGIVSTFNPLYIVDSGGSWRFPGFLKN